MVYKFDCDLWGANFSVPSKVVDDYIKISDGTFIKVLLCILCSSSREIDTAELAKKSGLGEETVIDAITHWQNLGVISAQKSVDSVAQPLSAENVQPAVNVDAPVKAEKPPVSAVEAVNPTKAAVSHKLCIRYKNSEILEKVNKDSDLKHLFNEIQTVLQYTINGTEQGELLALYEYYHFDVASILLAAEYCVSMEKRRVSYIVTVMKRWYELDICTYAQIEAEIIRLTDIKSFESKVLKAFGVETKPSKQQLEYISKWRSMGFSLEMLEIAYERCVNNTNKLSFKYIDTILNNWSGKSITSPQQVADEDTRYKGKKQVRQQTDKQTSYNLDDYEEFAMNYDLSKSGKL